VHEVLDLLEEESFFLKPAKCKFEQQLIDYLGIVVTKGTVVKVRLDLVLNVSKSGLNKVD
jgi:hypothetical protein